ncbi:MAG TPA: NUDIX domain-containing protein, partial [Burkholderiales bacterium]|nr:NUDIX domain-containing protein [Burkholderiales bacterium]
MAAADATAPARARIEVVAAVIYNERGEFLLAQRPPGKPYAGYWEFPGGKVEPGEAAAAALKRELHEELG